MAQMPSIAVLISRKHMAATALVLDLLNGATLGRELKQDSLVPGNEKDADAEWPSMGPTSSSVQEGVCAYMII